MTLASGRTRAWHQSGMWQVAGSMTGTWGSAQVCQGLPLWGVPLVTLAAGRAGGWRPLDGCHDTIYLVTGR